MIQSIATPQELASILFASLNMNPFPTCRVELPNSLYSQFPAEQRGRLRSTAFRLLGDSDSNLENYGIIDIQLATGEGTVTVLGPQPRSGYERLRDEMTVVRRKLLKLLKQPSSLPFDPVVRCGIASRELTGKQQFRLQEILRLEITRIVANELDISVDVHVDAKPNETNVGTCRLDALRGKYARVLRRQVAEIACDVVEEFQVLLGPTAAPSRPLIPQNEQAAQFRNILESEELYLLYATEVLNAIPRRVGYVSPPRT